MPHNGPYVDLRPQRAGLDIATQQRIIELYQQRGASLRSVAAEVYVHPGTVYNVLVRAGIPRKPRGGRRGDNSVGNRSLTTEQLLEVGELYATGLGLQAIADQLGISRSTVIWRLRRLGYVKRTRSESAYLGHRTRRIRKLREEAYCAQEDYRDRYGEDPDLSQFC